MCEREQIPLAVMVGDDEVKNGTVVVKAMLKKDLGKVKGDDSGKGAVVKRNDMLSFIQSTLLDIIKY